MSTMENKKENKIIRFCLWLLTAASTIGIVMQLTIKDSIPVFQVFFYGMPPGMILVMAVASLFIAKKQRRKAFVVYNVILLVISMVLWVRTDIVINKPNPTTGQTCKVLLWNLAHPTLKASAYLKPLKQADADIMAFVESGETDDAFWKSHFPDYFVSSPGGEITLLSKDPIKDIRIYECGTRSHYIVSHISTEADVIDVVIVDWEGTPFISRKPFFQEMEAILTPEPTIVLGDFNTPRNSVLISDIRRSYTEAFEAAGNGLMTTWPTFFPVLSLDHIFVSSHFQPFKTEIKRTHYSDHAMVITELKRK